MKAPDYKKKIKRKCTQMPVKEEKKIGDQDDKVSLTNFMFYIKDFDCENWWIFGKNV